MSSINNHSYQYYHHNIYLVIRNNNKKKTSQVVNKVTNKRKYTEDPLVLFKKKRDTITNSSYLCKIISIKTRLKNKWEI